MNNKFKVNKILFLGRENCKYSKKLSSFLIKKCKHFTFIDNKKKFRTTINLKKQIYDYIFCFRSPIIIKNNLIKKTKIALINFHPGPPNYRGIGCVNFAVYNDEIYYGSTAHLIENEKIDSGKIIDVKKFKIKKKYTIDKILKITHKNMYQQAIKLINKILLNNNFIQVQIKKNSKIKWSGKLYTRKELNKFYEIKKNISEKNFIRKMKSTNTKNFKPYVIIHNKKFYLSEN